MKFAHIADCHLGCWRDADINKLSMDNFENIIIDCINEKVDFIIIAGDIFETSYPPLAILTSAAKIFRKLKDAKIPVYVISGSHDSSPTDNTILNVFTEAGLLLNVMKASWDKNGKINLVFTEDPKTKIKITGILGRKRGLEASIYEDLERKSLENEPGFKIFLLHTAISELKPKYYKEESSPQSLIPQNFQYYAAGHIHQVIPSFEINEEKILKSEILYPGPTFPTDFEEMEKNIGGGYFIVEPINSKVKVNWRKSINYKVISFKFDAENKNLAQVTKELDKFIKENDFNDKIVTIRIFGELKSGNTIDLNLNEYISQMREKGAKSVLKNTIKFSSKDFEIGRPPVGNSREEIEQIFFKENLNTGIVSDWTEQMEMKIAKEILKKISISKDMGEKVKDYDAKISNSLLSLFGLKKEWEEFDDN